jgi:hypothetical protein
MTHKRLFLQDITDEHLTHLHRAAIVSADGKTARDWIKEIADGELALYEVPGGIIGLKKEPKQVFVELLAGNMMAQHRQDILASVKELANGRPVEGFVVNPRAAKVYQRLGFKPVGTFMRLDNEQSA